MQQKPEVTSHSSPDTTLPDTLDLDPEVQLKSAMLALWEREMPELFEYASNIVFLVYNAQNNWMELADTYSTQYYPALKQLEKVGKQLLEAQTPSRDTQPWSNEERARAFDTIAQPLSAEFADILQGATVFLPDMLEKIIHASYSGFFEEDGRKEDLLNLACRRRWTQCFDGLMSLKHRICALGLIREGETEQVDLGGLCERLAKGMPATRLVASDESSSYTVQAPSQLTEAVMMVLGREMLGVAVEARERIQRSLQGITVFDIGTPALESREQKRRAVSLVTGGELLKVACYPNGCLSLGIPVPREDFTLLAWLKDRVSAVVRHYRDSVAQIGCDLLTEVGDYAAEEEHDHAEYRLSVRFQLSDATSTNSASSHSLESSVVDDEWPSLVSYSLLQRTPAGRSYYMSMSKAALSSGKLECGSEMLSFIESIVDAVQSIDSVRIERKLLDVKVFLSSDEDDVEDAQQDFDIGDGEDESDLTESLDESTGQGKEYMFVFCANQTRIQQLGSERRNSIQGTFRQLEAVASMGFKAARVIPDRPLQTLPFPQVGLPASFLGNKDLMEAFLQISSRCNIGEFVVVDTPRAMDYLTAAQAALVEYCAHSGISEKLTLHLRTSTFVRTNVGLVPSPGAFLQFISPSGAILAEGTYSPTAKAFEVIAVPQAILQPLTKAIVEVVNEQLADRGVLLLVPFGQAIENRGFRIPDKVLSGLFLYFKALDGREVGLEMEDRVRDYLQTSFKEIRTYPPKFDGKICLILSDDELPPEERKK